MKTEYTYSGISCSLPNARQSHLLYRAPPVVAFQIRREPTKDLCALYNAEGKDGLSKLILFDAHTDMDINGKKESSNYHHYHESRYADYVNKHPTARQSMTDWLKRDPSVQKKNRAR